MSKTFAVILNFNGRDCLLQTLGSLIRSDYSNMELILVDNGSTDGSLEMAKRIYPKMVVIKNELNLGYAAGNNLGIEYALAHDADYIWLLNNDIKVEIKTLSNLVQLAESNPKIGLVSPVILSSSNDIWFSGGKINWVKMKTKHLHKRLSRDYFGSEYLTGCALFVKAEVFKKAGLLDEKYFLYLEDADFSLRARKKGYKLAVSSQARIVHYENSNNNSQSKIYWLVISGLLFFKKHTPLILRPWMTFYLMLRKIKNKIDILLGKNDPAKSVARAYKDFNYAK